MTYEEYISYTKEQEKLPDTDFNFPAMREYHNCYLFLGKWEGLDLYIHIDENNFEKKIFLYLCKTCGIGYKADKKDPLDCDQRQEILNSFKLRISDATVYGNGSGEYYTSEISIEQYYHKFSKYSGYGTDETGEFVPNGKMKKNSDIAERRVYGLEILKRWNQFVFNHFIKKEKAKIK